MWKDLVRRLTSTIFVVTPLAIAVLFSRHYLAFFVILLYLLMLAAVASWEYVELIRAKRFKIPKKTQIIGAVFVTLSFILSLFYQNYLFFTLTALFIFFLIFFFRHFKRIENAMVEIAASAFGLVYVAVPIGMVLPILYPASYLYDGRWWFVYLLVVTKITDVAAYFGGKLFGKHTLAPTISPQKTKEGAATGLLFAVLASLFFSYYGPAFPGGGFFLSIYPALFLGIILGIAGQLGDLAESLLKRDAGVKDSNKLPGLGGVLDMLDSLLFNIPIVYIYLNG